jgi:hypothetical protein
VHHGLKPLETGNIPILSEVHPFVNTLFRQIIMPLPSVLLSPTTTIIIEIESFDPGLLTQKLSFLYKSAF